MNFIIQLFYGPTGTGKSRLMKKISNELKRPFIEISGSDIYNKWTGKSEKNAELVNIAKIWSKEKLNCRCVPRGSCLPAVLSSH